MISAFDTKAQANQFSYHKVVMTTLAELDPDLAYPATDSAPDSETKEFESYGE